MRKPRVMLRACPEYDPDTISGILKESVADLGMRFSGNVFIKPNVVTANRRYIHNSFTHPSVVAAMAGIVKNDPVRRVTVGESGGYGIPSRLFLKEAGYYEMARQAGVDLVDLNEHPVVEKPLEKAKWHKRILLSTYIAEADCKIWMPKLKYHIFASITNCLKLNIGILTHRERMLFHDHRIHEKIVDLLEPGYPDLIVSDAIDITYGFESAPYPVRLGLLMIADHPLAIDVVAAHIMGYDPHEVTHLKIASERGYGSLELEDISLSGDADLAELAARPKGKHRLFQVLEELDTPIRFYSGQAWDTGMMCDGGCEGAVKGCLGTIEKRSPGSLRKARAGAIVCGVYDGDVVMPDGPVLLVGDCTKVCGRLEAKKIYRARGCPIGARDLMIKVPLIFRLPSPMADARDAGLFIWNSVVKGLQIVKNRFFRGARE
ncbi:MAG: DUF362 domain-containing protein [Thermodesulfobacteriota bacterium]